MFHRILYFTYVTQNEKENSWNFTFFSPKIPNLFN